MSRSARREQTPREPDRRPPAQSRAEQAPPKQVEETIARVEGLYRSLTGQPPPPIAETGHAPIPPEVDPAAHVEHQMDRLLQALSQFGPAVETPRWAPEVSVWEDEDAWLLLVDLPGLTREQVQVRLEGNLLVVSGNREGPVGDRKLAPKWVERRIGPFYREIPLPQFFAPEALHATMKEGVLEIRLPRGEDPSRRANIAVN